MIEHVATIIANPGKRKLDHTLTQTFRNALESAGLTPSAPDMLSEEEAVDIMFLAPDQSFAAKAVESAIGEQPFDFILQPVAHRRKQLLVTDMDSTVIEQECIDEMAAYWAKISGKPEIAEEIPRITERAMRGELDFEGALAARVALLEGMPVSAFNTIKREVITFTPGARELVATMRKNGAHCVLVSGGFTPFTSWVREQLGFHEDFANTLEVREGRLTGKVVPPILGKDAKRETLLKQCKSLGISLSASLAAGDGANDLPMLQTCEQGNGLGVAFRAKPRVQQEVATRLNHTGLKSLLFAQGYRAGEI